MAERCAPQIGEGRARRNEGLKQRQGAGFQHAPLCSGQPEWLVSVHVGRVVQHDLTLWPQPVCPLSQGHTTDVTSKSGGALNKLRQVEAQKPEEPRTGIPENLTADPTSGREKYGPSIDGELITRLKLYAVRNRLEHHEVLEAAIEASLNTREGQC